MTKKKLKQRVRTRMAETGESYTTALRAVRLQAPAAASGKPSGTTSEVYRSAKASEAEDDADDAK